MRRYFTNAGGAAALEFALWLGLLTVPLLNAIDLGFYCFQSIQVHEAAQVAAQSAEALCSPSGNVPAVSNCSGLRAQLTAAAQSTSLGTRVTVNTSSSSTWEGYYCSNTTGGLTVVTGDTWGLTGAPPGPAPNCSTTVTGNNNTASDYIVVNVTYTFTPLFKGVSAASLLNSTISQSAWMRLA